MQIHMVLCLNGEASIATLSANIDKVYAARSRRLTDRPAWLVADNATAKAVSEKLGINTGDGGISALVTTVGDYFGRAEPDLWSWIKVQWEATDGPSGLSATAA
jgi:hypothetical protein